jgi:hypothetical protein
MVNFKQTPAKTVADCVYYFCKFQSGSDKFWTKVSNELDFGSLTI